MLILHSYCSCSTGAIRAWAEACWLRVNRRAGLRPYPALIHVCLSLISQSAVVIFLAPFLKWIFRLIFWCFPCRVFTYALNFTLQGRMVDSAGNVIEMTKRTPELRVNKAANMTTTVALYLTILICSCLFSYAFYAHAAKNIWEERGGCGSRAR